MEPEDIERFEEERELELYREYRDVLRCSPTSSRPSAASTWRTRSTSSVRTEGWVQVDLADAWVWDMFRPARFVSSVRVMTRRDVNVEELARRDEPTTIPEPS